MVKNLVGFDAVAGVFVQLASRIMRSVYPWFLGFQGQGVGVVAPTCREVRFYRFGLCDGKPHDGDTVGVIDS